MPAFRRTRSNVDDTDSESGGSPTIGKQSNKRNKVLGNAPATDGKLRSSPQKLAVYIVAAKLGADRTAGLSKLVGESADYILAGDADEADVIVTGIGMQQRLERSISAELIVSCRCPSHTFWEHSTQTLSQDRKPIVKPEWLERSINEGKRQPYSRYQALYVKQDRVTDDATTLGDHGDDLADKEEVTTSAQADLSPDAKYTCQRESPLVCQNQELVEQIDVIRRAREFDTKWQNALSYGRAIAVGSLKRHFMRCANVSSR